MTSVVPTKCPGCGADWKPQWVSCELCGTDGDYSGPRRRVSLLEDVDVHLPCQVIGGFGHDLRVGSQIFVRFSGAGIEFLEGVPASVSVSLRFEEIRGIQITGPGKVTTGGGFIGGGFGVQGAITGIAIASLLNTLTKRTNMFTFIQIETSSGEIFLHYPGTEPAALRIELSPIFVQLRDRRPRELGE